MTEMKVPFVDLAAQSAEILPEVEPAIRSILSRGSFIGGPAVAEFESAYADYVGVEHCVGVGNGTDALALALRAAGVGPGDEVILPANTFIATAEAVSLAGARPVIVDVDPRYLLIDPSAVAAAVTDQTAAIMPVHLFGQCAPMAELLDIARAAGAVVIEDAAQAQGASRAGRRAGTWGVASGTSFYPGKNLGAAGDAGAVLTDDPDLAHQVRVLADHGSPRKYVHDVVGVNSRLDALQATVLTAKLRRLERWNEARREAARRYDDLLADIEGLVLPGRHPDNVDVWHLYVVQVQERDQVIAGLATDGVAAGVHYPTPVHLTGAYAHLGHGAGSFPVAEAAANRILSLPLYPHISEQQQVYVRDRLAEALGQGSRGAKAATSTGP